MYTYMYICTYFVVSTTVVVLVIVSSVSERAAAQPVIQKERAKECAHRQKEIDTKVGRKSQAKLILTLFLSNKYIHMYNLLNC